MVMIQTATWAFKTLQAEVSNAVKQQQKKKARRLWWHLTEHFFLQTTSHLKANNIYFIMFIIHSQLSLGVKSEVVGGAERQEDGKVFFFPQLFQKNRTEKKKKKRVWREFGEVFFFSALITGLLSDRSLSKSYKLEGGGWNRDWATLSQSLSLFHFSLHKHEQAKARRKPYTHTHDWKHVLHAKSRSDIT